MEQQKRYGHFDDQHREYVITDPQTPWPWNNYLGNEDFFSLISNTAGGYSFYKMPSSVASPAIATTTYRWTMADAISTSRMAKRYGTRVGSPVRRRSTSTSVVMV